ncbi:MAG: hypothetical protein N3G22_01405 [Candidatus Micrarchaeota archaeon]|nr:hypothetical protein [Candidatus Micrarchaeota archaeon]
MKNSSSRKGFLFTLLALSILGFILMVMPIWIATFEKADQRAAARFKGEAMRSLFHAISDETFSDFANASSFFALRKLTLYASNVSTPLPWKDSAATDPRNPHTDAVAESILSLVLEGNATPTSVPLVYSDEEKNAYTFKAWKDRVAKAVNMMGFNISFSDLKNFSFRQRDEWTVEAYFEMEMNISDFEKTMRQSKRLRANVSFPINGFRDAMVSRMDAVQRCNSGSLCTNFVERQIFRNDQYPSPASLQPVLLSRPPRAVGGGAGWFYGPITSLYPYEMEIDQLANISSYILVRSWDENLTNYANLYGGIIITNLPSEITYNVTEGSCEYNITEQTRCINCIRRYTSNMPGCAARVELVPATIINRPFLEIGGSDWINEIRAVRRAGLPDERYVLIENQYSLPEQKLEGHHRLWDLSSIRDVLMCGFYVKGKGPSFFQRMLADAQNINNPALGIESFVVGTWAGGSEDSSYSSPPQDASHETFSRLDWEFYRRWSGEKIKGMPGCKSREMCGSPDNNATKLGVGRFTLTTDSIARYGLGELSCTKYPQAGCS